MDAHSLISAGPAAGEIKELLEKALTTSCHRPSRPVAFIEQKFPDFGKLAEILRISANSGYWTNFGPVSALLESALEQYLNLPSSRAVVMCSSGTTALLSLIALKEHSCGPEFKMGRLGLRISFHVARPPGRCNRAGL